MSLSLVTAPTVEPVSLAEIKAHLRVDTNDEDAYLHSLISAARQYFDGRSGTLGRALNTQTWKMTLPAFSDWINIPLPPLQSVSSVKYYDTSDSLQTVATTVYEVIVDGTAGGAVHLLGDQNWPTAVSTNKKEPIEIEFVAGYGDSWNDVPRPIRQAIMFIVAQFYETREPVIQGSVASKIPFTVDAIVAPYRLVGWL